MTTIDPREVAARIRKCPTCGSDHYVIELAEGLPPKIRALRCAACGADILRAYRAAAPTPFGITIGQLDRLVLLTGAAFAVVMLFRFLFR